MSKLSRFSRVRSLFRRVTRSFLTLLSGAFAGAFAFGIHAQAIPAGTGLTDPTISYNLSGISDWSSAVPFLDLVKSMRPIFGSNPDVFTAISHDDLMTGGYLDESGWPKAVPPGIATVGTIWDWNGENGAFGASEMHKGIYIMRYKGRGKVELGGAAKILRSRPGEIMFSNKTGGSFWLGLSHIDPGKTGDYIRDISIVPQKYLALYDAGAVFNPDWLAIVKDARELRFADWMEVNNSTQVAWSDRPKADDATWAIKGVPVEILVTLANLAGTDPWFCMPHMASDEYITNFATYVRDHLNPDLKAHVEYSNETWNGLFDQYRWLDQQSRAKWGVSAETDYAAKRATEVAIIWNRVFGGEARSRLVNVLGTQTANPRIAARLLEPDVWKEHEPNHYTAPGTVFNALAITSYFGGAVVSDPTYRDRLLTAISKSGTQAGALLTSTLQDPKIPLSLPDSLVLWRANKVIADEYHLGLVAYEGGQHVHQLFGLNELTEANLAVLTPFMKDYVRSPQMADLYAEAWKAWESVGSGPFMQFGEVAEPGKWGSWGLIASLTDKTPRSELLNKLNATTSDWWGEGGGSRYQEGVIRLGSAAGETLVGTEKDDFLIGGDGDDILVPGKGHDGLNGGGGTNTVILEGNASDYKLVAEGNGYRLTGPAVSDHLLNIQKFQFDGAKTLSLDEMLGR